MVIDIRIVESSIGMLRSVPPGWAVLMQAGVAAAFGIHRMYAVEPSQNGRAGTYIRRCAANAHAADGFECKFWLDNDCWQAVEDGLEIA
jgi:hypothetical protein